MELHSLLDHLPLFEPDQGETSLEVSGLAYDSREVQPGDLFVAWRGLRHDGHAFVADACRRGAVAVVAESPVVADVPVIVVPDGRQALARLSAAFYGFPSRRLRLIGVTGTNGKTTTTHLMKAVLEQAGHKVGLIGTIRHLIGNEVIQSHRTTPESLDLQRLLFQMAERGMDYAIMEVSSHALALRRVAGTEFDVAVFTNLSQDHLDFHADMDDYFGAKAELFRMVAESGTKPNKAIIINGDDPRAPGLEMDGDARIIRFFIDDGARGNGPDGTESLDALRPSPAVVNISARDVRVRPEGVSYDALTPAGQLSLNLQLTGRFNVYNSLAAAAVGWHEGVPLPFLRTGLEDVAGVPGRVERIAGDHDFTVLVDYAHTPDSLERVLETCRQFTAGRIITVFGCGGDRDHDKRPLMGDIAARMSDKVILTADNPRSEDAAAICRDIEKGIVEGDGSDVAYEIVVDRRRAIRKAVASARTGDVVLIAGKGHETTQQFHDRTIHFDDREVAARALKERFGHATEDG